MSDTVDQTAPHGYTVHQGGLMGIIQDNTMRKSTEEHTIERSVTLSDLKKSGGKIIRDVHLTKQSVIVTLNGLPIAKIVPYE